MAVFTEGKTLSDVLLFEGENAISRTALTTAETVLGTVLNPAGEKVKVDGTDAVAGVLVGPNMVVDYHAIVAKDQLVWFASVNQANKDGYLKKLAALGVKAR